MEMRALAKRAATAVLTPIRFSMTTGHFRSSLIRRAVDRHGDPIPWLTYPAVHLLAQMDFSKDDVLEFGGGQSTVWWSERARSVRTLETDVRWATEIRRNVAARPNVTVEIFSTATAMAAAVAGTKADIVIVDNGDDRLPTARAAQQVAHDDGLIILDNSDGFWSTDGSETYPILDLLNAAGWCRIDLGGYAAGALTPGFTSIFFKNGTRRFRNLPPPPRLPR